MTQALRGEPLRVEERRDGWARVVTAYDYPGWIRDEALEDGEGELPADAAGSPVEVARSYLGAPYLWGGMTERGIDCSGLVHMAYRRLGRLVPRDADQQEDAARRGRRARARRPDHLRRARSTTSPSGSARAGSSTRPAARTGSAWSRRTSPSTCGRGATSSIRL